MLEHALPTGVIGEEMDSGNVAGMAVTDGGNPILVLVTCKMAQYLKRIVGKGLMTG